MEQRAGRVKRQGNDNKEASVTRFVTKDTFDSYNWQTIERKQGFISQVMSGKCPTRTMEDIDESVLSFAQIKALSISDPRFKEKAELDTAVSKLKIMKTNHHTQIYAMEDKLRKYYPPEINHAKEMIERNQKDYEIVQAHPIKDGAFSISIQGITYTDKETAGNAILEACKTLQNPDETILLGEYRGFQLKLYFELGQHYLNMEQSLSHRIEISDSAIGLISRMNNSLENINKNLIEWNNRLSTLQDELSQIKEEVKRPFSKELELKQKSERLAQLNAELLVENKTAKLPEADKTNMEGSDAKKSVLKTLQQLDKTIPPFVAKEKNISRERI